MNNTVGLAFSPWCIYLMCILRDLTSPWHQDSLSLPTLSSASEGTYRGCGQDPAGDPRSLTALTLPILSASWSLVPTQSSSVLQFCAFSLRSKLGSSRARGTAFAQSASAPGSMPSPIKRNNKNKLKESKYFSTGKWLGDKHGIFPGATSCLCFLGETNGSGDLLSVSLLHDVLSRYIVLKTPPHIQTYSGTVPALRNWDIFQGGTILLPRVQHWT